MPTVTGNPGRRAADIIERARERQVPVMTKREAARRAGISVEGWNKALKKGAGRTQTFMAMARVVGVEAEVRMALGLAPAPSSEPAAELPAIVRENWQNENVRKLWSLTVSEEQRVSLIEDVLAAEQAERENNGASA